jgi:hypothetical protein
VPDKIYILDEIVVPQADCAVLSAAYIERYAPSARARGMTLEGRWRTPPIELAGREMTLFYLWSVAGPGEWWGMRLGQARANPDLDVAIEGDEEKTRWWRWVDGIATSRKRSFLVDQPGAADDV